MFSARSWDYWTVRVVTGVTVQGVSGAPWVDQDGRVVGVQIGEMFDMDGKGFGQAFMADASDITQFVAGGESPPLWSLRAAYIDDAPPHVAVNPDGIRRPGAWIWDLDATGPLGSAGVKAGWKVLAIDGRPVARARDAIQDLRSRVSDAGIRVELLTPDAPSTREVVVRPVRVDL